MNKDTRGEMAQSWKKDFLNGPLKVWNELMPVNVWDEYDASVAGVGWSAFVRSVKRPMESTSIDQALFILQSTTTENLFRFVKASYFTVRERSL